MDALPFYKWHWRDYRANRRVQRMPWQAKGLYRELLDEFWSEGSLPTDHAELADICGCTPEEFAQWWSYMAPCWEERDGRLFNAKMDEQRTASDKARVAMKNGGSAGGKKSNSYTREKGTPDEAKGTLADDKPTLAVAQGMPDIARAEQEQSRAEGLSEELVAKLSPEVVAREVMAASGIHGDKNYRLIFDVCKREQANGIQADNLLAEMPKAWAFFQEQTANLQYKPGAEKFFGEWKWRDHSTWPWKPRSAPPAPVTQRLSAAERQQQEISAYQRQTTQEAA